MHFHFISLYNHIRALPVDNTTARLITSFNGDLLLWGPLIFHWSPINALYYSLPSNTVVETFSGPRALYI